MLEEGAGIKLRRVADVASLGVSDDKLVGVLRSEVSHCLLEGGQSLYAQALIEGQIGLVSHAIGRCRVDDRFVEGENRVFLVQQMLRNLLYVGIQSYAKEGLFLLDMLE